MTEDIKNNIISVIKNCEIVQFCTFKENDYPETRIIINMLNLDIKNIEQLHFITNKNSHKIKQISKNKNVCLYYFNPENRHAITLFGEAVQVENEKEKQSFWNDAFKKFGYASKDDENFCVIRFEPKLYKLYTERLEEHTGNI